MGSPRRVVLRPVGDGLGTTVHQSGSSGSLREELNEREHHVETCESTTLPDNSTELVRGGRRYGHEPLTHQLHIGTLSPFGLGNDAYDGSLAA